MSAATVRVAQPFIRTPSQVVAVFLTRGLWHGPPHGSTPAHGGDVRDDLSRFSLWRCSLARSIAYRIERFVTSRSDAEAAACAAVDRFGRVDVLVNTAASFYAGYFEELTPEQFERQLPVSLIGPLNVTRAVLPVMRKQRAGHIISISSSAGLAAGFDFVSAYAASKFGLEGWMESLHAEVAPFGITTTIVNPGFFRTELLTEQSTNYAEASIKDYDERRGPLVEYWKAQNGNQSGDPAKLARAIMTIA